MKNQATRGIDFDGAAQDIELSARRYAPLYSHPDLRECVKLLHRNPQLAPVIRQVIEAEMAKLPGGGRGMNEPLFPRDTARKNTA